MSVHVALPRISENIEDLAGRSSVFLDAGALDMMDFASNGGKIDNINCNLEELENKLNKKRNGVYRLCSATETAPALKSSFNKLSHIETDMRLLIAAARLDVKNALQIEMIPGKNIARDKQRLLENSRKAPGPEVSESRMNQLFCGARSKESFLTYREGTCTRKD